MPSSSHSADAPLPVKGIIDKLSESFLSKGKNSFPKSVPKNTHSATDSNGVLCCWSANQAQPNSTPVPADPIPNKLELYDRFKKLERDIKYAECAYTKLKDLEQKSAHTKLKDLEQNFSAYQTPEQHFGNLRKNWNSFPKYKWEDDIPTKEVYDKVSLLEEMLRDLRHQIKNALRKKKDEYHGGDGGGTVGTTFDAYYLVGEKQSEDMKKKIQGSSAFLDFYEDFLEVFNYLEPKTKLCLLCFSVFPEKAVVKKRILVQWWIGEGFVDDRSDATSILWNIVAKGFIEPDLENRRLAGFKMDPLVRLVVVRIAEECRFLSFDPLGVPADDISWSHRACLVVRGKESSRARLTRGVHQAKLHTLFNVNDPYPDFKEEWFSKLKNLNVLCLGGWQGSAGQHVEIEDTEFLDALENMEYLRFLSLQGTSRITKLPDSICKLKNLLVLDLRACHNLEALPKNIDALKNLTHFDVSECYLLDHIPEVLASLTQLQVLKGFLIGQSTSKKSCGLEALGKLKELRKLSINTAREDFPRPEEVKVLRSLEHLEKLKITWRGKPSKTQSGKSSRPERASLNSRYERAVKRTFIDGNCAKQEDSSAQHPTSPQSAGQPALVPQPSKKSTSMDGTAATGASPDPGENKTNLQKLELQCFPETTPPGWLTEGKLKPEKKLYISGGKLQSLRAEPGKDITWTVQVLRLRFLRDLKGDWGEVQKLFPGLVYLEKAKCPRLSFFPCDENGVWLKQESESEMADLGLTWSFRRRRTPLKCT
ncbi:uncharacterized protein LOC115739694 [Rhodamnia argentea]|uniref:Uncharacterized protein LOC115739694 n=1 Tax=Rhodamnia argentea TaxID=178133 RepID=A0A8B8P1S2_9MYRT|nr:uncharacterized protein LOC115739694 [Rhodamnia argentea]